MNAHTSFDTSTAVATLADVDAICAGRDEAIGHWQAAYNAFHEHTAAASKSCIGQAFFSVPRAASYESSEVAEAFVLAPTAMYEGWTEGTGPYATGRERIKKPAAEHFAEVITAHIDRGCWSSLLSMTGAEALMDRQAKQEWRDSLKSPAPFTPENCKATFGHLWGSRRELFLRGIAQAFAKLDRRFRSHDGFKVGARLIIDGALDTQWTSTHWKHYDRRDTFNDVERILYELEGLPAPDGGETVVDQVSGLAVSSLPQVVQGRFFRVRVFKNGNLHIWFENDELLRRVNKLLAEYYGEALADGYNETEADDAPAYHVTPAKNFGEFFTSDAVAEKVTDWANISRDTRVLEPSAGGGALARAARKLGGDVQCVEVQPGRAHELGLDGFAVECGDFLKMAESDLGSFDVVLMNPPFDRGRDCDHVRHAWQFVRPGGRLVAIMSARAEYGDDKRHKALHRIVDQAKGMGWGDTKWHDLPAGSFAHAGTNVNTVCLVLTKPKA